MASLVCFVPEIVRVTAGARRLNPRLRSDELHYLEVASGSIPLFLIVSEARAEARNSLSRLELYVTPIYFMVGEIGFVL